MTLAEVCGDAHSTTFLYVGFGSKQVHMTLLAIFYSTNSITFTEPVY